MEKTYTVKQLLDMFKKHIQLILTCMFAGLALSGVVTFFIITPKYSSQAQLVVTLPQSDSTNVNDVNSNLQMINTYKDFIVSDLVLNQVQSRLDTQYKIEMEPKEIKNLISVEQSQNSQMFSIIVTTTKSVEAAHIANTVAKTFQDNAKDVLNVDRITITSSAVAESDPVSPNKKLFLAAGLILGALIGIIATLLIELMDRTVKDATFLTEELGFTLLGTVPEISDKDIAVNIKKTRKLVDGELSQAATQKTESSTEPRRRRSRV
jgi:capsular polysaccharide biosynthesis protein